MSAAQHFQLDPEGDQLERGIIPLAAADPQKVTQRIYQTINPLPAWRVGATLKLVLIEVCTLFENGKDWRTKRNKYEYSRNNKEMGKELGLFHMTVSKRITQLRELGLLLVKQFPDKGNLRLLTPAPVLRNAYLYDKWEPLYELLFPVDEEAVVAEVPAEEANPSGLEGLTPVDDTPAPPRPRASRAPKAGNTAPLMNLHVGTPVPAPAPEPPAPAGPPVPSHSDYRRRAQRVAADKPGSRPYEFPPHFASPEFLEAWDRYSALPKQQKRTHTVRQEDLTLLGEVSEEFAIVRLGECIRGNYTCCWYPETPQQYKRWQKARGLDQQRDGQDSTPSNTQKVFTQLQNALSDNEYDESGNRNNRPSF